MRQITYTDNNADTRLESLLSRITEEKKTSLHPKATLCALKSASVLGDPILVGISGWKYCDSETHEILEIDKCKVDFYKDKVITAIEPILLEDAFISTLSVRSYERDMGTTEEEQLITHNSSLSFCKEPYHHGTQLDPTDDHHGYLELYMTPHRAKSILRVGFALIFKTLLRCKLISAEHYTQALFDLGSSELYESVAILEKHNQSKTSNTILQSILRKIDVRMPRNANGELNTMYFELLALMHTNDLEGMNIHEVLLRLNEVAKKLHHGQLMSQSDVEFLAIHATCLVREDDEESVRWYNYLISNSVSTYARELIFYTQCAEDSALCLLLCGLPLRIKSYSRYSFSNLTKKFIKDCPFCEHLSIGFQAKIKSCRAMYDREYSHYFDEGIGSLLDIKPLQSWQLDLTMSKYNDVLAAKNLAPCLINPKLNHIIIKLFGADVQLDDGLEDFSHLSGTIISSKRINKVVLSSHAKSMHAGYLWKIAKTWSEVINDDNAGLLQDMMSNDLEESTEGFDLDGDEFRTLRRLLNELKNPKSKLVTFESGSFLFSRVLKTGSSMIAVPLQIAVNGMQFRPVDGILAKVTRNMELTESEFKEVIDICMNDDLTLINPGLKVIYDQLLSNEVRRDKHGVMERGLSRRFFDMLSFSCDACVVMNESFLSEYGVRLRRLSKPSRSNLVLF
jgi:hypothetical protein